MGATRILVAGDWIIDENWVLATHRSPTSTVEGKAHLRALGSFASGVRTFCGAGRVARFLYWRNRFLKPKPDAGSQILHFVPLDSRSDRVWFDVFGLGAWAVQDQGRLFQMFHPGYTPGVNPFTLVRGTTTTPDYAQLEGLYLCTIGGDTSHFVDNFGTTHVYRLYQHQVNRPRGLDLDRRVDFELKFPHQSDEIYAHPQLSQVLKQMRTDTEAGPRLHRAAFAREALRKLKRLNRGFEAQSWLPGEVQEAVVRHLQEVESQLESLCKADRRQSGTRPGESFKYVAIKDLGKGVVCKSLIAQLKRSGLVDRHTEWFVSSKVPEPDWLEDITGECGRLRLLLIPPIAVTQQYVGETGTRDNPAFVSKWFLGSKRVPGSGIAPSREALEALEHFKRYLTPSSKHPSLVVAMPKGLSFLALNCADTETGFYQGDPVLDEIDEELAGRASMFFAALTGEIITAEEIGVELDIKAVLNVSSRAAEEWVHDVIAELRALGDSRLGIPRMWDPSLAEYREHEGLGWRTEEITWKDERSRWDQALGAEPTPETPNPAVPIGIIREGEQRRLELWRAMTILSDYVETVQEKRREVARLIQILREFSHDFGHVVGLRSVSAHLIAKPGSGKSHLVSRLAAELGMQCLNFNLTQLVTRQNVIECFDTIASAQTQDRSRPYLVFFDEINAKVDGEPAYDLFLSVLEEGTYMRQGQKFKLAPCAWIFAGTDKPPRKGAVDGATDKENEDTSEKKSDFLSRLTTQVFLDEPQGSFVSKRTESQTKLGFVYLAAVQLQSLNPDITKISAGVLFHFYRLPADSSLRAIRKYAERFRHIQYGEVHVRNMPEELRRAGDKKTEKEDTQLWITAFGKTVANRDVMIDIVRQPSDAGSIRKITPAVSVARGEVEVVGLKSKGGGGLGTAVQDGATARPTLASTVQNGKLGRRVRRARMRGMAKRIKAVDVVGLADKSK